MAMETSSATTTGLSEWAAPYVTTMLGKAEALSNLPFQPYTGAFTAPESALQSQAFKGIGALTVPESLSSAGKGMADIASRAGSMAYSPTQFTSTYQAPTAYQAATFDPTKYSTATVQPYMNPYLESVLEPQRREAVRQADIARQAMQSKMAQAGAYGGSRQAIMESEAQRNLQELLGDITGKGYAGAYEDAAKRFADEEARRMAAAKFGEESRQFGYEKGMTAAETAARYGLDALRDTEKSRQYGAQYGLDALAKQIEAARNAADIAGKGSELERANLSAMLSAGATQRDIEQQGLTADYNQYLRELEYPQKMLEFQRNMLTGIPITTYATQTPAASGFQSAAGGAATALQLLKLLQQTSGG